jgi:hypothetical protein
MLKIALAGKDYQFYSFTEILAFINSLELAEHRKFVAEQGINLLPESNLDYEMIEYYGTQLNSFIPQEEEHGQETTTGRGHNCLSGFYL